MSTVNFKVIYADSNGMVLEFTKEGEPPVQWGCRLPYQGETLAEVAALYDPRAHWEDLKRARVVPEVGTEGSATELAPVINGVPQAVTRFQARAALHLGGYLPQVEAIMADPATPALAKLAWQDAREFKRNSPTIAALAGMLGLTDATLDHLFRVASQIDA